MTFQIVEFAEKHLPTIVRLLNDERENTREFIPFDEERVLSQIRKRHLNLLVLEKRGEVVGCVGTHSHENSEEHITWLVAAIGQGREAIDNLLLDEVERSVKAQAIVMTVDEGSPRIATMTRRGYELRPGFQRMRARLDGLRPIPKVAVDAELRSLRSDEEDQFIETVNKGFGWKRVEQGDLYKWKLEDPPFTEEWVQVAEVKGELVSVVVAKPDTEAMEYLHIHRGYLGPAATLPEFRNRNFASALTSQAMNFLFRKGMDSVILGTSEENASSIALLQNLGFQMDNIRRKTLRKQLSSKHAKGYA